MAAKTGGVKFASRAFIWPYLFCLGVVRRVVRAGQTLTPLWARRLSLIDAQGATSL